MTSPAASSKSRAGRVCLGVLLILLDKERGPRTPLMESPPRTQQNPAQQEVLFMGVLEAEEGDGPRGSEVFLRPNRS